MSPCNEQLLRISPVPYVSTFAGFAGPLQGLQSMMLMLRPAMLYVAQLLQLDDASKRFLAIVGNQNQPAVSFHLLKILRARLRAHQQGRVMNWSAFVTKMLSEAGAFASKTL